MAFTSIIFLVFLAFVFIVYYMVPADKRWLVLLVASIIFYFSFSVKMTIFLLVSAISTYSGALMMAQLQDKQGLLEEEIGKKEAKAKIKMQKRRVLIGVLLLNFGILIFLKYFNFAVENLEELMALLGLEKEFSGLNIMLPLGISFYTFQSTGYVIDVFRQKVLPEKNFLRYLLFVSYFPQIVQGPISRFGQLSKELFKKIEFDERNFKFGLQLILWGYFKKMIIADRAGFLVDTVFNNYDEYSGVYNIIAVVFYCIQIYGDFSGGIDIVRGISQALGIHVVENFKRPYFARSVTEFWQRWHITLGTWMKDYVFYPLALSKPFGKIGRVTRKRFGSFIGKQLPASLASLIVFTLVGVWHGSSWKFVAFGLYHGVFILSSTMLAPTYEKVLKKLGINTATHSWIMFQILRTFMITAVGRYFSRAKSFRAAIAMMRSSVQDFNPWILWDGSLLDLGIDFPNMLLLALALLLFFGVSFVQEQGIGIRVWLEEQNLMFRWMIYIFGIMAILIFGVYGDSFDKTSFIYQGF